MSVRMIVEKLRITKSIVHQFVMEELEIRQICDKLGLQIDHVPRKIQRRKSSPITVKWVWGQKKNHF